jgi:hypothetical protein
LANEIVVEERMMDCLITFQNHVGGCGTPSRNDDEATRRARRECLARASRELGGCVGRSTLSGASRIVRDPAGVGYIDTLLEFKMAFDGEWNKNVKAAVKDIRQSAKPVIA